MALREIFARFGAQYDGGPKLKQAESQVDSLTDAAHGLVAAFAGNAIFEGIKGYAEALDTFDDLSAQTKVSTEALQTWGYAAKLSGSSSEEFNASLTLLQKSLGNTAEGTGAQVDALKKLHVSLKTADGSQKSLNEVLPEVLDNFSGLSSEADKAQVATALFGRSGVKLIPTLERGRAGFEALRGEMAEFGGPVGEETIAQAGEFRDNLVRLDTAMFALKGTLASALFPQLSKVIVAVGHGVKSVADFVHGTTIADHAGLALAATLAGPLLSAFGPFIGKGLKFAAVFAAVDDLLGFLEGKDSLIGDLLDRAFGAGTADVVRDWVNDAIDNFGRFLESGEATFDAIGTDGALTFTGLLAGFVGFVRDASQGFPFLRTAGAAVFDGIYADLLSFVARGIAAWDAFVQGLALPDFVKGALKVNAAPVEAAAKGAREASQTRSAEAQAIGRGANSNVFGTEASSVGLAQRRLAEQRAGAASVEGILQATIPPDVLARSREGRRARVNRERGEAQANATAALPENVTATIASAAEKHQVTAQYTDNRSIQLTFAKGTSAADQSAIKNAVAAALKAQNREALQALTQVSK